MNDELIQDLKQFIAATVSQQLAQQTTELREEFNGLRQDFKKLAKKVDDLTDFVTGAIDTSNDATGKQLKDHERRITKLEHARAA